MGDYDINYAVGRISQNIIDYATHMITLDIPNKITNQQESVKLRALMILLKSHRLFFTLIFQTIYSVSQRQK